jgi:putative ABC transport system permease protein
MERLFQDLRYGVRTLFKNPGFTLVAIITLALGIGANTAIFSVVNAVLLRPLPYNEPERIVRMYGRFSQGNQASVSPPDFLDYRAQNHSFEEFAALRSTSYNLTGNSDPERIIGAEVTANFFQALGVKPVRGRVFLPEEEQAAQSQVAIISEGLWQRRFGADPAILDKSILLNGQNHVIVGVIANQARLSEETDVWRPLTFDGPNMKVRRFHFLRVIGRLNPDTTLQQAQADVDAIALGLEKLYPESNTSWRLRMVGLRQELLGDISTPLYILLGAVAFVLLIACANVANLQLARSTARQKEFAIRAALGASRLRLIRQLVTESLLLAFVGGAVGLLLGIWGTELLVKAAPLTIPRAGEIGLDNQVLGFTLGLSLITGIIFGVVPAWQSSRIDLNESLKDSSKGAGAGTHHQRTRNILVVAEIALALVLLVCAGLLLQSFRRLQNIDPGFDAHNVLTMRVFLPELKYGEPGQAGHFFEQVLQRVAALPGVQSVGTTTQLPMRGGGDTYFKIEGRPFADPKQQVTALNPEISQDYLKAMGIALVKGRNFTEQETKEQPRTVIINETFARDYFLDEEPLGKRLIIDEGEPLSCEIIGVARNVKQFSLSSQSIATMYMPRIGIGRATLVVRTSGDPLALVSAVRDAVQAVDKDQPVASVQSMEQILSGSVAEERFRTSLLTIFAVVALGLAVIGIYGVMSYTVAQRTREIGIRLALGAQANNVLRLIVGQGLLLVLIGVTMGMAAALGLTRLIKDLLFDVSATDPSIFASIAVFLTLVALLACYVPARRAMKVDPMEALRYE